MTRPYQSGIQVSDDYLLAAGQALYNFASTKGVAAYLVESLIPGYINLTREKNADAIAKDLQLASAIKPDAETTSFSEDFSALVNRWNDLLLALPVSAKDNEQLLSTLHHDAELWTAETLWDFAKDAEALVTRGGALYETRRKA